MLRGVNTGGVSSTVSVYIDETPFGSSSGSGQRRDSRRRLRPVRYRSDRSPARPSGHALRCKLAGRRAQVRDQHAGAGRVPARARAGIEFSRSAAALGHNVNGVVNVPLGDSLRSVRAVSTARTPAGSTAPARMPTSSGFRRSAARTSTTATSDGARGSLLFKPTDALAIRLTGIGQRIKSDASSDRCPSTQAISRSTASSARRRYFREPNKLKFTSSTATVDYDFGFASLLSSTSFGKNNQTSATI